MEDKQKQLNQEQAQELLAAGVHYGQPLSKRCPKMDKFVYGVSSNGMQIIDLDKTWAALQEAGETLKKLYSENKNVLFVGANKKAVSRIVGEFAEKHELHFVNSRWLGGTLTNPVTRNRINYLHELEGMENSGLIDSMTAKEKSAVTKRLRKLRKNLGGMKKIRGAIHAIVLIDPVYEENAVLEAFSKKNSLKILTITDTDCHFTPESFDNLIPCNVSSIQSLRKVMNELMTYVEAGRKAASEKKAATPTGGARPATRRPAVRKLGSNAAVAGARKPASIAAKPAEAKKEVPATPKAES